MANVLSFQVVELSVHDTDILTGHELRLYERVGELYRGRAGLIGE